MSRIPKKYRVSTAEFPVLVTIRATRRPIDVHRTIQKIFVLVETLINPPSPTNPQLLELQLTALQAAVKKTKAQIAAAKPPTPPKL